MSNKVIWGENKICDDNGNVILERLGPSQIHFYNLAKKHNQLEEFIIGFHASNCNCDLCRKYGFGTDE